MVYSEHVGMKRQLGPMKGLIIYWYAFINVTRKRDIAGPSPPEFVIRQQDPFLLLLTEAYVTVR